MTVAQFYGPVDDKITKLIGDKAHQIKKTGNNAPLILVVGTFHTHATAVFRDVHTRNMLFVNPLPTNWNDSVANRKFDTKCFCLRFC